MKTPGTPAIYNAAVDLAKASSTITCGAGRLLPAWPRLLLGALFITLTAAYFTQDVSHSRVASSQANGDGIYYYAYLRSLVFDRDLDFENDYELLGNPFKPEENRVTGKVENPFPAGTVLYWLPTLGAAHLVLGAGRLLGLSDDQLDGTSPTYQRFVFYGSLLWGFGVLLLTFCLARRVCGEGTAALAAVGLVMATPLIWYMRYQAAYSHAVSAFAVAAFAAYWYVTLFRKQSRHWAVLGLLAGLAMLVRPQNAAHMVLPLGEWLLLAGGALRRRDLGGAGRLIGLGTLFGLCAMVAFLPQVAVWKVLYGSWFTIPQGHSFMLWEHSRWVETLFSSRNGLFARTPLVYLAVIGLLVMASRRQDKEQHIAGWLMLLAFALQVYINGSTRDWYGGWAHGGRRFLGCSLYFGLGLATLLSVLTPRRKGAGRWLAVGASALLVLFFSLFNINLMDKLILADKHISRSESMAIHWRAVLGVGFDRVYQVIGNPGSIPANWVFALRSGAPPSRYDEVSGLQLFEPIMFLGKQRDFYQHPFADRGLTLSGFGDVDTVDEVKGIWATGPRAKLLLPLRAPVEMAGKVLLRPALPETHLTLKVGDVTLFDGPLGKGWKVYEFHVPARAVTAGLNYLLVQQRLPGGASQSRATARRGVLWGELRLDRVKDSGAR